MNLDTLKTELGRDEGVRTEPYDCPAGARTTGVGRNLDANPLTPAEVRIIPQALIARVDTQRLYARVADGH